MVRNSRKNSGAILGHALACALLALSASCTKIVGDHMTMTSDVQAIAEKYIAEKYPTFDKRNKTPSLTDEGDQFLFTYELPEGVIGGAPVVVIDKKTMKVVRAYRTQ